MKLLTPPRFVFIVLYIVLTVAAVHAIIATQATPGGSIEGVVRFADGNNAVPSAIVVLRRATNSAVSSFETVAELVTDTAGTFRFADVPPATYRLSVRREGYVPEGYGTSLTGTQGKRVDLPEGASSKDHVLLMVAAARISGRVTEQEGKPLLGIQVELLQPTWEASLRGVRFRRVRSGVTDDLGHYRMWDIPPGEYYLRTSAIDLPVSRRVPSEEFTIATTYYPSGDSVLSSEKIIVPPGGLNDRADFVVRKIEARRLRGRIIDLREVPQQENSRSTLTVNLIPRDVVLGTALSSGERTPLAADGSFTMNEVKPGRYWIYTTLATIPAALSAANIGPGAIDVQTRGAILKQALESILSNPSTRLGADIRQVDIETSDVEVVIPIKSTAALNGRAVSLRGGMPPNLRVGLAPVSNSAPQLSVLRPSATTLADGSFVISGIMPWEGEEYRIDVDTLPQNMYVKDVHLGERMLASHSLSVVATQIDPLIITLGDKASGINGTVTEREGASVDIAVVAINTAAVLTEACRVALTDSRGYFELRQLPPGSYTLIAATAREDQAYCDPNVQRHLQGVDVKLAENETHTVLFKNVVAIDPSW